MCQKLENRQKDGRTMIGTIVNTGTILTGSILGSVLKKGIGEKYQSALYTAMGLAAIGLGINAVVGNMAKSQYPVLLIPIIFFIVKNIFGF